MRISLINPSRFSAVQSSLSSLLLPLSSSSRLNIFFFVTMADVSTDANNGVSAEEVVVDDNVKFGFQRAEMHSESLSGTVIPYDRHVFLCYKTYEAWPARVESSESDPLPKRLAGALKARKNDISVKTLLTICEGGEDTGLSDGDVLIFPEMIKYRGLQESDIDSFVEEVLVNGKPWASGIQEVLTGSHVFVCAHNSRDKRCGICGPALIEKFKEEIELRGLKDQVFVSACSHVGGHKYAGNLIIYSAVQGDKVSGHWYGYVTPNDVPELLDQHIGKGVVIERIWRGQMGVPPVQQAEKADEHTLPNGNDLKVSEKETQENSTKEEKESGGGCCQGANGFSCCRDESLEAKKEGKKMICFTKKWEQHELFTAAAVVGAVVTVVVAYSFYKRSR